MMPLKARPLRVQPGNLRELDSLIRRLQAEIGLSELGEIAALSVVANPDAADAVPEALAAASNDTFLARRSNALTFAALLDADIPATIARDSELTAAVSALNLASGTYTPTLTNAANLDASTAYQCQYCRVGSIVHVSGRVDVDPTAGAVTTRLGIALPIASDLGATEDCAGAAFASGVAGQGAAIRGDATNNRAEMIWISADTNNEPMYFSFSYEVL